MLSQKFDHMQSELVGMRAQQATLVQEAERIQGSQRALLELQSAAHSQAESCPSSSAGPSGGEPGTVARDAVGDPASPDTHGQCTRHEPDRRMTEPFSYPIRQ